MTLFFFRVTAHSPGRYRRAFVWVLSHFYLYRSLVVAVTAAALRSTYPGTAAVQCLVRVQQ